MTKVLALTAAEAPFRSRLIETQFIDPLVGARGSASAEWQLSFLSLIPAAFYLSRRHPLGQMAVSLNRMSALRSSLSARGIGYRTYLMMYPFLPRQFNLKRREAAIFTALSLPGLVLELLLRRPDLMIARSYPAALLAYHAKRVLGIPFLFDLRGMYPEESVNAGSYGMGSNDYRYWKEWEKRLVSSALRNIVVSQPFVEHIKGIDPGAPAEFIPCCVDDSRLKLPDKSDIKDKYGLEGRFVLLHLGSFGTPGDRGLVGKYLKRFRQVRPGAVLVIASGTPAFGPAIRKALHQEGLGPEDFRIFHPAGTEIQEMLALGDAGLILERKMANTKVCLSVKLGEYLAAGMPVICTPHVEGVVRLIEEYQCGMAIDPDRNEPLEKERAFLEGHQKMKDNGFKLVKEVLSLERCSGRWRQIIEEALKERTGGKNVQ